MIGIDCLHALGRETGSIPCIQLGPSPICAVILFHHVQLEKGTQLSLQAWAGFLPFNLLFSLLFAAFLSPPSFRLPGPVRSAHEYYFILLSGSVSAGYLVCGCPSLRCMHFASPAADKVVVSNADSLDPSLLFYFFFFFSSEKGTLLGIRMQQTCQV